MVMKIALDVSALPPRLAGAGRYVAELAQRLPSLAEVTIVARRNDAERWRTLSSAPVVPMVANHRAVRLVDEAFRVGRSSVARRSDVWHAPHYTMPRTGHRPTVVTIHDLTFFTNPEWHEPAKVAFFQRAIRYAAAHADALVCVSAFTAGELTEHVQVNAPVFVAPHGVDHHRFSPSGDDAWTLATADLTPTAPFVLFVGTLEPRKGIDVLLEAFATVASNDSAVELWLVGQPGWGLDAIETALRDHPFAARIKRLGYVADDVLPALYRTASVVAYPSRGEGFGLPVLEALACGALVVTSADTVMAEVAADTAVLTPVGDAPALATAITDLLGTTEDVRARRERASEHAATFTWERSVHVHMQAYAAALARHRS